MSDPRARRRCPPSATGSSRRGQLRQHRVARLDRGQLATDLGRGEVLLEAALDGSLDAVLAGTPEVRQQHAAAEHLPERVGDALPGDVGGAAADALEEAEVTGSDVPRPCQTDAALDRRAEVGHDVTEQVVRDDDVEVLGGLDHAHRQDVHVQVRCLDVGVLVGDDLEDALPEVMTVPHGVGLVAHADAGLAVGHSPLEGGADDPLDALAGVHLGLHRHLVQGAALELATDAVVQALGVLAEDDEVDVLAALADEDGAPGVEQPHGAEVDVEVRLEAAVEQQLLGVDVAGHPRIPEGAHQDRAEVSLPARQQLVGEGGAIAQVALGAEVELFEHQSGVDEAQHAHRLPDDVRTDAVTRDDSDLEGKYHG